MLAASSPQCPQYSCTPHDAAVYATHGHAPFYPPPLQEYQQLLLQQVQQLQQQLASQHANTPALIPHCSVGAACASPASAPSTCTHRQQHQQQGGQGKWHGSPPNCQHAAVRQDSFGLHRCRQALYATPREMGPLTSQESDQQEKQDSCQQQQQPTTYSSSCVSFPSQEHCATGGNRRGHSQNRIHGPVCKHSSSGISRALFGSPSATVLQPTCDRQKGQSCTSNTVYTSSNTSTAVASEYWGIDNSQKPADSAAADLCHRQKGSLAVAVGSIDSTDKTCLASANTFLQTPELCTAASWQSKGSSNSACDSKEAQATPSTAHHAPAGAAATPTAVPCSTADASPARVQSLVEQLEQRLSTLQNLLHTPTVLDDSLHTENARLEHEIAAASPALQPGSCPAPLPVYDQSDASDSMSAAVTTATVQVDSDVIRRNGHPECVHAQRQPTQEVSLGSRQQCSSPTGLTFGAAKPKKAHPDYQQKQGLGIAAILQTDLSACKQQGYQQSSYQQPNLEQQQPWPTLPQSKGQHLDLSRGGAALVKANACSDKLMFALLLASKKCVK